MTTVAPAGHVQGAEKKKTRRQFVRFAFYKLDPAWRRLPIEQREADKQEMIEAIEGCGQRMLLRTYSLTATRGDADLLLWQVAEDLGAFQDLANRINATHLGSYLTLPYAYLSMTRRSIYEIRDNPGEDSARLTILPTTARYLFVYPFVKTRAWYMLSQQERQAMMDEHIVVGRKYPSVKLNTTYSYGLDDQEFVVAFESDEPADFLDLVMDLRVTAASNYTLRDTPTFTCVAMPLRETLDSLGGVQSHQGNVAPAQSAPTAQDYGIRNREYTPAPLATRLSPNGENSKLGKDFTHVAELSDLGLGESKLVYVAGEAVALFNVDGHIYAISNRCTHARGSLCEGELAGHTVICPYHGGSFDLRTGQALSLPARIPVPTYAVQIYDGGIYVSVGRSEEERVEGRAQ